MPVTIVRRTALLAAIALVIATPAAAGNQQRFTDPAGDNEGAGTANYAVDVTTVDVSSLDDGTITFRVTIVTSAADAGQMYTGDKVTVLIDADNNRTTGVGGNEGALHAHGQTGQPPRFEFCAHDPRVNVFTCQPGLPENFFGTITPPTTQVLNFTFEQANWFLIGFQVESTYVSGATTRRDLAPSSGLYMYDVHADHDRDGLSGFADACPSRSGGRFDRNGDGCPGPYRRMPAVSVSYQGLQRSSSSVVYRSFGVTGAPAGTSVRVQVGRSSFTRRGNGPIRALAGRRLAAGTRIVITFSRAGWCSSFRILRISPGAGTGFATVARGVRQPGGGIRCA
jgi:hypothetical protein